MMTEEQIIARLQAARLDKPRHAPKASASARASETFKANRKPIRAVIAEALIHNAALTERLCEERKLLDEMDCWRVDQVLAAIRDLGEAIETLGNIESPSWSFGEAKRDAIQRQVLSVLKPRER